jgi:hypothetical protein
MAIALKNKQEWPNGHDITEKYARTVLLLLLFLVGWDLVHRGHYCPTLVTLQDMANCRNEEITAIKGSRSTTWGNPRRQTDGGRKRERNNFIRCHRSVICYKYYGTAM